MIGDRDKLGEQFGGIHIVVDKSISENLQKYFLRNYLIIGHAKDQTIYNARISIIEFGELAALFFLMFESYIH